MSSLLWSSLLWSSLATPGIGNLLPAPWPGSAPPAPRVVPTPEPKSRTKPCVRAPSPGPPSAGIPWRRFGYRRGYACFTPLTASARSVGRRMAANYGVIAPNGGVEFSTSSVLRARIFAWRNSPLCNTIARTAAKPLPIQNVDVYTDTRDILANARRNAAKRGFNDWFICDIDAHHVESVSWAEIVGHIEDPVIREQALMYHRERIGAPPYGLIGDFGLRYQDVGGRIPHQSDRRETVDDKSVHRDVVL